MNLASFEKSVRQLAVRLILAGFVLMLVSQKDAVAIIIKLMFRYGFQAGLCLSALGLALAAWSKTMNKAQPVDAATLAARLMEPLHGQLNAKDQQIEVCQDQNKALTEAIAALPKAAAPAAQINEALQELEQGSTLKAQAIFAEALRTKKPRGRKARKKAAAAARQLSALAYLNNPEEALAACQKAVELDPDNADGWNRLGNLLYRIGELAQAQAAYSKVLAVGEAHEDKEEQVKGIGNLGVVYRTCGDLDKAEGMYRKALELHQALGSKQGLARDYANLGFVCADRGDLDKAEEMHRKALKFDQALGSKESMAQDYGNLGALYEKRGELDQAEELWRKSLSLFQVIGHPNAERVQQLLNELTQHRANQQAPPAANPR